MVVAKLFDAVGTTMELAGKYEMLQELANILMLAYAQSVVDAHVDLQYWP